MALTVLGQPEAEKERQFSRWQGRQLIRKREKLKRDLQRLKMKGPQPKTGLRA